MATISHQRGTILQVLNDVARRMGYDPFASVSANRTSLAWVGYLNDALAEVADYGDWPQAYEEVVASAAVGQHRVEVNASAPVRRVMEVHHGSARAALSETDISNYRAQSRNSSVGTPRQWALVDASGVNPRLRVLPAPSTAQASGNFNIALYTMPRTYGSADAALTLPWSRQLLVNGLWARALTDEAGGGATRQAEAAFVLFRDGLRREYNRTVAAAGDADITLSVPRDLWR